jgi:succinate dehydrogenase / fumarate reductase flavoprotein subunit
MMQANVGIVRREEEMKRALEGIKELMQRADKCGVTGAREYNPGWHTAVDLGNLLMISEGVARAAIERKESRGAQFRDDYPTKSDEYGKFNIVLRKAGDGSMQVIRQPLTPVRADLQQVIEENK